MFKDTVIGPGAFVKFARFMVQGDGTTPLTKVGFNIRASSTMDTLTQIAGAALYKESGTNPASARRKIIMSRALTLPTPPLAR